MADRTKVASSADRRPTIDLEAIKALAEAATPGPWLWAVDEDVEWVVCDLTYHALASCRYGWGPNAAFIATAREDVPALVEALEAAMSRIAELEARE